MVGCCFSGFCRSSVHEKFILRSRVFDWKSTVSPPMLRGLIVIQSSYHPSTQPRPPPLQRPPPPCYQGMHLKTTRTTFALMVIFTQSAHAVQRSLCDRASVQHCMGADFVHRSRFDIRSTQRYRPHLLICQITFQASLY